MGPGSGSALRAAENTVGVRLLYNTTSGLNETVEVNRTTWSTFDVTRADGRNWTRPYTFRINDTGLWKVPFPSLQGRRRLVSP